MLSDSNNIFTYCTTPTEERLFQFNRALEIIKNCCIGDFDASFIEAQLIHRLRTHTERPDLNMESVRITFSCIEGRIVSIKPSVMSQKDGPPLTEGFIPHAWVCFPPSFFDVSESGQIFPILFRIRRDRGVKTSLLLFSVGAILSTFSTTEIIKLEKTICSVQNMETYRRVSIAEILVGGPELKVTIHGFQAGRDKDEVQLHPKEDLLLVCENIRSIISTPITSEFIHAASNSHQ